jgi:hypothetical protein
MSQQSKRRDQIVWVSNQVWRNDVTITSIHVHEGREYGYCTIAGVTWLCRHVANKDYPIWQPVGWIRTT